MEQGGGGMMEEREFYVIPHLCQESGNENSVLAKWLSVCRPKTESRGRQRERERERHLHRAEDSG